MKLILKKKAITNQNFSVYKKKSTQDDVFVHKLLRKLVPSVCLLVGHRARAAQQYHAKEVGFYPSCKSGSLKLPELKGHLLQA